MGTPAEGTPQQSPAAGGSEQQTTEQQQPAERQQPKFVGSSTGEPLESTEQQQAQPDKTGEASTEEQPKVVGHGGKEMTPEAISERVERANKKLLRELLGTDDFEKAKELVAKAKNAGNLTKEDEAEYQRLKRLEEARKRTRMTQEQRTKAVLSEKDQKIKQLEEELTSLRVQGAVEQQDQVITRLAEPFVDPKYMRYARRDLAEYLNTLKTEKPDQFKRFGEKQLERWFAKFVEDNPSFKLKPPPDETGEQGGTPKPPERKVVQKVVAGPKPRQAPTPAEKDGAGQLNGKTVKPGQPNSMSKAELRDYMKQQGRRMW